MITSIPVSALELGISFNEFPKLAKNVRRMKYLTKWQRQEILERGDREFPKEVIPKIMKLIKDISCYDKEFCKVAEIPYDKGRSDMVELSGTGVTDYLLRNKHLIYP